MSATRQAKGSGSVARWAMADGLAMAYRGIVVGVSGSARRPCSPYWLKPFSVAYGDSRE